MSASGPVVLVEGASDAAAIEVLAARRGIDLGAAGVTVVNLGGVTNVGAAARSVPPTTRLLALCDAAEERFVARALSPRAGAGWFVCDRDLEDEMIRAIGTDGVLDLLAAHDELDSFRILQRQPAHRDGATHDQLRRFLGTRSGRKHRYGAILAGAVPLDRVPAPLDRLLAALGAG